MEAASIYTVCSSGCDETSIQAVFNNNNLGAGDMVEVRADTPGGIRSYYETVTTGSNDTGLDGNPVILRARAGDNIIIDGQDIRSSAIRINIFSNLYFEILTLSRIVLVECSSRNSEIIFLS